MHAGRCVPEAYRVAMSTYHELQSFGNNDLTFVNVISDEPGSSANYFVINPNVMAKAHDPAFT
jgi:hypothetical protein